jgi:cell division protein FtsI (penicillin-binding protein 3)
VPGLEYCLEDARFYPEGNMLAGVLGFTGVDNQGLSGIEYFADKMLKGTAIPVNTIRDSRGKLILFDDRAVKTQPDSMVYLTMDVQMQGLAERILKTDLEEFQAKRAIALAMDVQTGEILVAAVAASSKNNLNEKNYVTSYLFEPGSIFKTVSFGFLIEKGLYNASAKVNTEKPVTLLGHSIKDVHTYPSLTQLEVFTKSSNIGTVRLTGKANRNDFYKFLIHCGFGKKTGIEWATEENGVLREPKNWSGLSQASLSIGQEIMVTPVQIVRYYAAVANGGVAVRPALVSHYFSDNKVTKLKTSSERVMSEDTAETLIKMLAATVDTGTGKRARTGMLNIGGKTGTAQIIDQKTKTYSKTNYIASFAGIFPVENPKVAMIVIYENPRSSIYGGDTSARTFRKIAEQVAFFYDIGGDSTRIQYANK